MVFPDWRDRGRYRGADQPVRVFAECCRTPAIFGIRGEIDCVATEKRPATGGCGPLLLA